jgi:glycosyltransferase involved in cell wall biosynthesis
MNHLVVLSPGFRRTLAARGVNEEKIEVIENWCDEEALRPVPRDPKLADELGLDDSFTVLFAGTMGVYQGLDAVLDAAALLYAAGDLVQFLFVGGGIERDRLISRAREIPTVRFLERRPTEEMPAIVAVADALLVHLKNDPLFEITIPSKTQAYLYAGRPILMAVRGDAADIVREAEAGVLCEPEDPVSIAEGIRCLAQLSAVERERMGQNGAAYYLREMSLKQGTDKFEAIFNRAVLVRREDR